jgi:hypothetical protein
MRFYCHEYILSRPSRPQRSRRPLRSNFIVHFFSELGMRNIKHTCKHETRWLSLLIAARWEQDTIMLNDLAAIDKSLRSRDIPDNQILSIQGTLNRKSLFSFLNKARQQITESNLCNVFLYYSGHGFFTGTNTSNAQPGLLLVHDT